jgi:hypothetical protein
LKGNLLAAGYRGYGIRLFRLDGSNDTLSTGSIQLLCTLVRSRSQVRDVMQSGDHLLVANDATGIEVYNVKNPSLPFLEGEFSYAVPEESAQSCSLYKNRIYVPSWDGGLKIFDLNLHEKNGAQN